MAIERLISQEAPRENFARGLYSVDIPELGQPIRGKVRDSWVLEDGKSSLRVLVTTDRQSAFDRIIGTTPGKGTVLNLMSAFWFNKTRDIIPNHALAVLHPNVLIAKQARATLPVEVVVRRFMAKSSTDTSVYSNYVDKEKREIYGLEFPDGLVANQEFPMGNIVTPTTKATVGHDEMLTGEEAKGIVDGSLGKGVWEQARQAALSIFERARNYCLEKGLILADTKYEFGIDENGELMLIDEVHTPDSSRFWLAETYEQRLAEGKNPDTFDKEILRRWLSEHGFKGQGPIPKIDPGIIDQMSKAYGVPYKMITGEELPSQDGNVAEQIREALVQKIFH